MSENGTFSFFGRIHPERAATNMSEMSAQHHSQFVDFELDVFAHGSQILVEVHPESEVEDLATLKNLVQSSISTLTDPIAFLDGKYVSVEISAVITPSGHKRVFGVEHNYISERISQDELNDEWFPKILAVYQTEAGPYLQRAFRDYRLALEHAEDTGFYCFRSIESLRQFYKEDNDAESWAKLREELGIDRETIEEEVQIHADERRHGDVYSLSGGERRDILVTTWEILKQFINTHVGEELDEAQ